MTVTATVTYNAQGSPDTALTFDLIGADVNACGTDSVKRKVSFKPE